MVLLKISFLHHSKFFLRLPLLDCDEALRKLIGSLFELAGTWRGKKLKLHQLQVFLDLHLTYGRSPIDRRFFLLLNIGRTLSMSVGILHYALVFVSIFVFVSRDHREVDSDLGA